MTIEQLNKIREEKRELLMVRKLVKEEGEKLAANTGYRNRSSSAAVPDVHLPVQERSSPRWKLSLRKKV